MTTLLVRNAEENNRAHSILTGPRGHEVSSVRYIGWPKLVFSCDEPLDVMRCAGNLEAMRETAEHHYCLVRYGTANRRYMTDDDRRAARLSAHFENGKRKVIIDLSHAMNGAAQAAVARAAELEAGEPAHLFDGLLTANDDGERAKDWSGHVGAALAIAARRLPASHITAVLLTAVVAFAIGWTCVKHTAVNLEHAFKMRAQDDEQQLKIAEFNARQLTGTDGKKVHLTSSAKLTLTREDAEDARRVTLMSNMEIEHPLLRFVAAEAHDGLAAALDMAPERGNVRVNGMEMRADTARGGAKALRRAAKAKRDWTTEVIPATDI
jgi:hypothetical protein